MVLKFNYMVQKNRETNIFLCMPVLASVHIFESDYTIFDNY